MQVGHIMHVMHNTSEQLWTVTAKPHCITVNGIVTAFTCRESEGGHFLIHLCDKPEPGSTITMYRAPL